jgi:hypothetical protein
LVVGDKYAHAGFAEVFMPKTLQPQNG